jgi:hypothetical protein
MQGADRGGIWDDGAACSFAPLWLIDSRTKGNRLERTDGNAIDERGCVNENAARVGESAGSQTPAFSQVSVFR